MNTCLCVYALVRVCVHTRAQLDAHGIQEAFLNLFETFTLFYVD